MSIRISRAVHRALLAHARSSPGQEVCGLLIERNGATRHVPAANVASEPMHSFEIDPRTLFEAIRSDRQGVERIVAYYHSHPTGPPEPSPRDAAQASPSGPIWLIIGQNVAKAWRFGQCGAFEQVEIEEVPDDPLFSGTCV